MLLGWTNARRAAGVPFPAPLPRPQVWVEIACGCAETALALGTPVATTNAGANPELIRNGETGLVFPYEDVEAMRTCIGMLHPEADVWKTCAANGRALVNGFTKDRMIKEVMDALV